MNTRWLPVLSTLALSLVSAQAHAQTPSAAVPSEHTAAPLAQHLAPTSPGDGATSPTTAEQTRWYGWQTLLVDGASLAVAGASLTLNEEALAAGLVLGASGYAVGAPLVHLSNGHPVKALVSFGVRALTGGVGMLLLGLGASSGVYGLILGAAAGAALLPGAIAMDAAWLAREDVTKTATDATTGGPQTRLTLPDSRRAHALRLAPTLDLQPTRFSAGLAGSF